MGHVLPCEMLVVQLSREVTSVHAGAGSQYIPKLYSGVIDGNPRSSYMEICGWVSVLLF